MSFVTVARSRGKAFVQAVLSQDAAAIAAQEAEIARRVRLEVGRLREKAEAEGRAQGEAEARAAMAPDAAALQSAATALSDAWGQLATPLAGKEHELAELVTELSFLLARHITGIDSATNPASLQNLVTRLIAEAATERGPRQTLLLRLNPADHTHLATVIPQETANLLADETIAQGGARIEIITPEGDPIDKIEWDATLSGRFDAIRTALGLPTPGTAAP
jgi:flagellar biosynthesis/type III secretory pathway protein FliH